MQYIAGTSDRENLIQFVAIHDFTYSQGLLAVHDVTAMGNAYRNALYAMGTVKCQCQM